MSLTYNFLSSDTDAPTAVRNRRGPHQSSRQDSGGWVQLAYGDDHSLRDHSDDQLHRSHWRDGQILAVSGANESDYNITARCTYVDANNVSIQVANSPATPATGTITCKVAGAGWSIAYTGTNIRSYRQPSNSTQLYLGVDDTGTTNARFRGFETMTAAGVATGSGTNLFPTEVQVSGGLYYYKSNSANTTARDWIAIVNDGFVLLFGGGGGGSAADYQGQLAFGDAVPNDASDVWPVVCYGAQVANQTAPYQFTASGLYPNNTTAIDGCYIVRSKSGAAGAVKAWNYAEWSVANGTSAYPPGVYGWMTYPAPNLGGLAMTPFEVVEASAYTSGPRLTIPGLWAPSSLDQFLTHKDTFSGAAGSSLAGKKFIIIKMNNNNYGTFACYIFELTDF